MKPLKEAQKLIEDLISKTPTGDLRNDLTDINILLSTGMNEIDDTMGKLKTAWADLLKAMN